MKTRANRSKGDESGFTLSEVMVAAMLVATELHHHHEFCGDESRDGVGASGRLGFLEHDHGRSRPN